MYCCGPKAIGYSGFYIIGTGDGRRGRHIAGLADWSDTAFLANQPHLPVNLHRNGIHHVYRVTAYSEIKALQIHPFMVGRHRYFDIQHSGHAYRPDIRHCTCSRHIAGRINSLFWRYPARYAQSRSHPYFYARHLHDGLYRRIHNIQSLIFQRL